MHGQRWASRGSDDGAAVVEFVMISVLLVLLLFAVLQVAVFFYARNIVAASAADAARYAAVSGAGPQNGEARARTLIDKALNAADAAAIRCTSRAGRDPESRLPVTTVHCHGRVQGLLVPLDIPLTIDVTSSALTEGGG